MVARQQRAPQGREPRKRVREELLKRPAVIAAPRGLPRGRQAVPGAVSPAQRQEATRAAPLVHFVPLAGDERRKQRIARDGRKRPLVDVPQVPAGLHEEIAGIDAPVVLDDQIGRARGGKGARGRAVLHKAHQQLVEHADIPRGRTVMIPAVKHLDEKRRVRVGSGHKARNALPALKAGYILHGSAAPLAEIIKKLSSPADCPRGDVSVLNATCAQRRYSRLGARGSDGCQDRGGASSHPRAVDRRPAAPFPKSRAHSSFGSMPLVCNTVTLAGFAIALHGVKRLPEKRGAA